MRARILGADLGVDRLWLKVEGENPTGTHKDRAAHAIVVHALAARLPGVAAGSCGSLGLALAQAARGAGLRCVIHIPRRYAAERFDAIARTGATIVRCDGGYEEAVAESSREARRLGLLDANPCGDGGQIALCAYGAIAREIVDQLGRVPRWVFVACGNGTTLAGIARGFARACGAMPHLGAAGSTGNTALTECIRRGRVLDLEAASLRESPVNEPLLNWRSFHAKEALDAVRCAGGLAVDASDDALETATARLALCEGIRCLPASAAALAGIADAARGGLLRGGDVVAVLTGRPSLSR